MKCGHFPVSFHECMSSQSLCHFLYYKSIIVINNEVYIGGTVCTVLVPLNFTSLKKLFHVKLPCQLYETDQHLWKKKYF